MSAVQNLEALINVENQLKEKYEAQLAEAAKKIEALESDKTALQATIDQQISKISELSANSMDSKRLEQLNREANNRADKIQAELDSIKSRAKSNQKELVDLKSELKTLKQFEPEKLKKNLAAAKKKNDEQRVANDLLKKNAKQAKSEALEYQRELESLKAELEQLKAEKTEEVNSEPEAETEA